MTTMELVDVQCCVNLRPWPWVRWLATDANGQTWAYAERPQLLVEYDCWAPMDARSEIAMVWRVPLCPNWRMTLVEVPPQNGRAKVLTDEELERQMARDAVVLLGCICTALALGFAAVGVAAGWW